MKNQGEIKYNSLRVANVILIIRMYMMNRGETILDDYMIATLARCSVEDVKNVLDFLTKHKMIKYDFSRGVRVIQPLPAFRYNAEKVKQQYKRNWSTQLYNILYDSVQSFDDLLDVFK